MPKSKVTDEQRREILLRWRSGEYQDDIAKKLKVTQRIVSYSIKKLLNLPVGTNGTRIQAHRTGSKYQRSTIHVPFVPPENPPPLDVPCELSPGEAAFFWGLVEKNGGDACWPWQGQLNGDGYGMFSTVNGNTGAHRVAWRLTFGPLGKRKGKKLYACHRCDIRKCVRPSHLFAGTAKDNARDCGVKNNYPTRAGAANNAARLDWVKVREIRRLREERHWQLQRIAKRFKVSETQVGKICANQAWLPQDEPKT